MNQPDLNILVMSPGTKRVLDETGDYADRTIWTHPMLADDRILAIPPEDFDDFKERFLADAERLRNGPDWIRLT